MIKYTNQSLRKLLGERGFIENSFPKKGKNGWSKSIWYRATVAVTLHEHDKMEPYLSKTANSYGAMITDPENELGYRNTNIQNDGSADE